MKNSFEKFKEKHPKKNKDREEDEFSNIAIRAAEMDDENSEDKEKPTIVNNKFLESIALKLFDYAHKRLEEDRTGDAEFAKQNRKFEKKMVIISFVVVFVIFLFLYLIS